MLRSVPDTLSKFAGVKGSATTCFLMRQQREFFNLYTLAFTSSRDQSSKD